MNIQDPVADMLTRIRNAGAASLKEVIIPHSIMKEQIASTMKEEGYITSFKSDGEGVSKMLIVTLKYYRGKPVIEGLKKISKPSCRSYCGSKEIPRVRNGLGTVIMSTPKGILAGQEAAKQNVGGEILCYVW
ncbi:MAG: 30S ribosomal protein S8 [Victivallaceae bacterium]|mgnify:CR=1 FL=1|nr:30S ribosomal protein S8 [Victivallaceae bacterium]MDD4180307.1 30S ribosomal protein S8 [Victivallaceae bacterium]